MAMSMQVPWARSPMEDVLELIPPSMLRRGGRGGIRGISWGFEETPKSNLPEYSEESFDKMGKSPVVKEILSGAVKLTEEQKEERIKLHLKGDK